MASSSSSDSGAELLLTLRRIAAGISSSVPHPAIRRRFSLLSSAFSDALQQHVRRGGGLPFSTALCLSELLILFRRFESLLLSPSSSSRFLRLLQSDDVAADLYSLSVDLAVHLDLLHDVVRDSANDNLLSADFPELISFAARQFRFHSSPLPSAADMALKSAIIAVIRDIELEIVPSRGTLASLFADLGISDERTCGDEIDDLENEIADRASSADRFTVEMLVSFVGLARYAKCVIFGLSDPNPDPNLEDAELTPPPDFRCPITLELMRDPVAVVASGQTFDRESIEQWFAAGHATCPKTAQALCNLDLVPNKALQSLIAHWCRANDVPYERSKSAKKKVSKLESDNKAAMVAARLTATFLVDTLADMGPSSSKVEANRVVREIRLFAKSGSEKRAFVATAGAVPLLVPLLYTDYAELQYNAVTALLNISILEANKKRIMHTDGAVDALVHVMHANGALWEAKENAAASVVSLCAVHSYSRRLGRKPLVVERLLELVKSGPVSTKRDALAAILSMASQRENISRLVECGAVEAAVEAMHSGELVDDAAAVVGAIAKRGGADAVLKADRAVAKLVAAMRRGSESGRESAAAALVMLCRRLGSEAVAKVMMVPGVEWAIWDLMGTGTDRARRKATSLGKLYRRWATAGVAGAEGDGTVVSTVTVAVPAVMA